MSWPTILAIGSGGFIGAVLRAYFNGLINRNIESTFPLGTLGVNIIGSFFIGVLFAYFIYATLPLQLKSFLTTGILGALTTYSTFAFETFLLIEGGAFLLAGANMALNLIGTIFAAGVGYKITNHLLST